jgi:hypothetical protein
MWDATRNTLSNRAREWWFFVLMGAVFTPVRTLEDTPTLSHALVEGFAQATPPIKTLRIEAATEKLG